MQFPLPVDVAARPVDTFTAPRSGGRVHEAIDLFAPKGTPILPLFAGEIVGLGWNTLGGRTITILDARRGVVAYYAHLDAYEPERRIRESVGLTSRLGWVGTSGNAELTPPHLHLQVRRVPSAATWRSGRPLNVSPVLEARWECARHTPASRP